MQAGDQGVRLSYSSQLLRHADGERDTGQSKPPAHALGVGESGRAAGTGATWHVTQGSPPVVFTALRFARLHPPPMTTFMEADSDQEPERPLWSLAQGLAKRQRQHVPSLHRSISDESRQNLGLWRGGARKWASVRSIASRVHTPNRSLLLPKERRGVVARRWRLLVSQKNQQYLHSGLVGRLFSFLSGQTPPSIHCPPKRLLFAISSPSQGCQNPRRNSTPCILRQTSPRPMVSTESSTATIAVMPYNPTRVQRISLCPPDPTPKAQRAS